jgi:hypothetical protein
LPHFDAFYILIASDFIDSSVHVAKKGTLNLVTNDELMDFLLHGVQHPCKGTLKNVRRVSFELNIAQGMLVLVLDFGNESKQLFNNIFKDLIGGGKPALSSGFSEGQTTAFKFVENEAIIRVKYKGMTHHFIESNMNVDGSNASNELGKSTFENTTDWDKLGSYFDLGGNRRMAIQLFG